MEEFVLFKALALFSPNEIDLSRSAREEVSRKRLDILKYLRKVGRGKEEREDVGGVTSRAARPLFRCPLARAAQ